MEQIRVILIENAESKVNVRRLKSWSSSLFKINEVSNLNLPHGIRNHCKDEDLKIITNNGQLTVVITTLNLDDNHVTRPVESNPNLIALSLYYNEYTSESRITTDEYILRIIYGITIIYLANKRRFLLSGDPDLKNPIHGNIRNCLFDYSQNQKDLREFFFAPSICTECINQLKQYDIPAFDLSTLEKEIKKFKEPWWSKLNSFDKQQPVVIKLAFFLLGVAFSFILFSIKSSLAFT